MKKGRAAKQCKMRMAQGCSVATLLNCADNSGAKNLYIIAVIGIGGRLNKLPNCSPGDLVLCSVKKGKPELRKKVLKGVVIRQKKAWRRREGACGQRVRRALAKDCLLCSCHLLSLVVLLDLPPPAAKTEHEKSSKLGMGDAWVSVERPVKDWCSVFPRIFGINFSVAALILDFESLRSGAQLPYQRVSSLPYVYQIYAGAAAEAGEEASLTCFMMVPTTSAGAVIGKQGANLKELRETLSLKVILSKEEIEGFRPCTLSGALDSILEAERRIQEQIVSPDGPPPSNGGVKRLLDAPEPEPFENKSHGTFISAYSEPEAKRPRPSAAAPRTTSESTKILVPANVAGAIIGKQGSTLKQIRESSGASIDVVKETQTPEFPGERVVNVRGSLDVRRNALPQVLTAAFEKDPANALIKMMVPSNLVGGIIGRQGANLKAIREQCGIHVQVGQKDQQTVHGERMVFATGGLEQVLSAAALVLDSAEAAAAPKSAVAGAFPEAGGCMWPHGERAGN
ncbi:unnamed protein product [Durusdinium trenchii]|uniref:K Homology domain-containing protein n=1 Tax=Durusdinium trenchii TaxID=1381693 RepID=A0ABP0PB81_9DINO